MKTDTSGAKDTLSRFLDKGADVYTISHQTSGTSARVRVFVIRTEEQGARLWEITNLVARVAGYRINERHGGCVASGGGVTLSHEVVQRLSMAMYGDSQALIHRNMH